MAANDQEMQQSKHKDTAQKPDNQPVLFLLVQLFSGCEKSVGALSPIHYSILVYNLNVLIYTGPVSLLLAHSQPPGEIGEIGDIKVT